MLIELYSLSMTNALYRQFDDCTGIWNMTRRGDLYMAYKGSDRVCHAWRFPLHLNQYYN